MGRIVGNLVGGPRDGQQVSVDEDVTEIASAVVDTSTVVDTDIEAKDGGKVQEHPPVGRYVKDPKKLRPAEAADLRDPNPRSSPELPLADVERFDHPLEQVCDFVYKAD